MIKKAKLELDRLVGEHLDLAPLAVEAVGGRAERHVLGQALDPQVDLDSCGQARSQIGCEIKCTLPKALCVMALWPMVRVAR